MASDAEQSVIAAGTDPSNPQWKAAVDRANDAIGGQTFANGPPDCPMRYWQMPPNYDDLLLFISGNWNPLANAPPPASYWTFCSLHDSELHLHP